MKIEDIDSEETFRKSKSQLKREAHELQQLGEQLTKLSADRLQRIRMPEELREAVLFAKSIKSRGALRRQIQTIGSLMRDIDAEPIRNALEDIAGGSKRQAIHFQKLERWRDALINEGELPLDESIEAIVEELPQADRQQLRRLALNARKERETSKPPKSSRALFRYLRELSEADCSEAPDAQGACNDGTDE